MNGKQTFIIENIVAETCTFSVFFHSHKNINYIKAEGLFIKYLSNKIPMIYLYLDTAKWLSDVHLEATTMDFYKINLTEKHQRSEVSLEAITIHFELPLDQLNGLEIEEYTCPVMIDASLLPRVYFTKIYGYVTWRVSMRGINLW